MFGYSVESYIFPSELSIVVSVSPNLYPVYLGVLLEATLHM